MNLIVEMSLFGDGRKKLGIGPLDSIELFTIRKSDRSVINKMQFLRIIPIKILQLGII